ncbi:MAG: hypothetical protein IPG71_12485 [bacterium]|nr:hypothetical protein [bacterium]
MHTTQTNDEALLKIQGEITGLGIRQLEAAIEHFRARGCKVIRIEHSGRPVNQVADWARAILDASTETIAIRQG